MKLTDANKIRDYVKEQINPYGKPFEGSVYEFGLKIIHYIDNMSTVYDIDKVIEDLESYRNEITCDIDIDNAIEIVKQGGISDDVCEWKLKDVCYTSSIKHYDALPTSIVKTFTSCPYCGKKIKVVE